MYSRLSSILYSKDKGTFVEQSFHGDGRGLLALRTAPAQEKYSRSGYLYFETIGDSDRARATVGTSLARVALLFCSN